MIKTQVEEMEEVPYAIRQKASLEARNVIVRLDSMRAALGLHGRFTSDFMAMRNIATSFLDSFTKRQFDRNQELFWQYARDVNAKLHREVRHIAVK